MNIKNTLFHATIFSLLSVTILSYAPNVQAGERYEGAVQLKASTFLAKEFRKNKLFTVKEAIKNDGFTNSYTVQSTFGTFQANSDIALYKLIRELKAIKAMQKVEQSDVFLEALEKSGVATVQGLKNLFTEPTDTVKNAISGIGSLFSRAEESLFKSSPGETEDSRLAQTLGFSNAKREVAFRYKVDVYSKNSILQEYLDRLAWAEYAGGLTLGVATMPIGGVAGVTLSVSGTARLLGEVIATTPPAELKLQNRTKLAKIGINENLADLFIENPYFSPLQQTAYIMALEKIKTVKDRSLPLQVALQVNNPDMARYLTATMVMFAGYNKNIIPVVKFKTVARFFCGINKKGQLIILLPADYITLNKRLTEGIRLSKGANISRYELWITGTASTKAQKFIKAAGWHLEQKIARKIGFKMNENR